MSESQKSQSSASPSAGVSGEQTSGLRARQAHSVLIVDDEPGARDALRLILEPQFCVLTADGGEAALKVLDQEDVSVMTLDLRMPGLSGPETLLKIREINSELEVIIVTAYASYTETMRALRLRAFDLVSKPFEPKQVLEAIRRATARREMRLQASSNEFLEGLSKRLIESIHGLSETEHRRLSESGKVNLDHIRASENRGSLLELSEEPPMMQTSRDRWPAILSGEQEQILMNAGFRYDGESGVLVHTELRKVLSVEAAAERGAEELRDFVQQKNHPGQVQVVFEGEAPARLRESLIRRYGW